MDKIKTKNLVDLDVIDSVGEGDYVLVESRGKFKKISSDAVGGSKVTTPDWDENDEESSSFIQNRTHYRTSLGNVYEINLDKYCEQFYDDEIEILAIGKTYARCCYTYFINDEYLRSFRSISKDINISATTSTVKINNTEYDLVNYCDGSEDSFYSYNDDICIHIYNDGSDFDPYICLNIHTNLENITSLSYSLLTTEEVFDYHKLNDSYLNGCLIKSGDAPYSEIFNYDGSSIASEILLTGDMGDTTYSFNSDLITDVLSLAVDKILLPDYPEIKVINISMNNNLLEGSCSGTITFSNTLNDTSNMNNTPIYLVYSSKIVCGQYSHAEGYHTTASGPSSHAEGDSTKSFEYCSHAEGSYTTASGPSSHAEGNQTTAYGYSSHAEGNLTTASGESSHAEGYRTVASGYQSHAEGNQTTASGDYSHAEGSNTTASGDHSHAEGVRTTASASFSHVEGDCTMASGESSHAEGSNTTASGLYSHAEGTHTTAQRRSQHVFGECNVLDTTGTDVNSKGTYIEIVGNGTADDARSNARTLDWNGNECLAGGITLGKGTTDEVTLTAAYLKYMIDGSGDESEEEVSPFFMIGMTRSGDNNEVLSLNQTWQDIRENIESGKICICKSINSTETISSVEMYLIHIVGTDSETYYVDAKDMFTTDTHHFTASQPDENPQITSQP